MEHPTHPHPLLSLVDSNANELKSLLTSYIDATVDSQYNCLKQNILSMIQSGQICSSSQNSTTFGQTLPPLPSIRANVDHSSAYLNTNNKTTDQPMIKQEFNDDAEEKKEEEYDSGEEIDDSNVANCVKCEKGICYSDGDDNEEEFTEDDTSGDEDSETEMENRDEHFNQINQSASSDDIFPSAATHANPIEPHSIKQEYLEDSALNDIAIDQPSANGSFDLVHNDLNREQSFPSTSSGVRSSARKRTPKIAFDYDQLNKDVIKRKRRKRKNVQSKVVPVPVKKVKPKIVEEDYDGDDNDEREDAKRDKTVILELHCTESDCDKVVKSRSFWREHMKNDHKKAPYQQVEENIRTNDRDQTLEYPCPEANCNCVYKSHKSCRSHWSHYHHPGKFKCPTCSFEDSLYHKVQRHLDTTHGTHECTHAGCGRKFFRLFKLKEHQSVHTEERPYWCVWPGCRWRCKQVWAATKHVRMKHFKVQQDGQNDQNVADSRDPHEFIVKKVRRLVQS